MKIGETEHTSNGRKMLNVYLIPRVANLMENGDGVLFVGTNTVWDYKPYFWNPIKQCLYVTLDINSNYNPDIVSSIEHCPMVPDETFALVMYIGMYEFVGDNQQAFKEIKRMLIPNGYLLVAFPGKGYRNEPWVVTLQMSYDLLKEYRMLETYCMYEHDPEPSSIIVLAQKI